MHFFFINRLSILIHNKPSLPLVVHIEKNPFCNDSASELKELNQALIKFHALIPCVAVGDVTKLTFNSQTVDVRHGIDAQVSLHHSALMRVLTIRCINKLRGCDKVIDSENAR